MKLFGRNILTTFLFFIALTKTTLAAVPTSDYPQSREIKVEREGKWSIASSPGTIQERTQQYDLEKGKAAMEAAVCTARAIRNKKVACFCVTLGVIVASAAACTAAVVTHHHVSYEHFNIGNC